VSEGGPAAAAGLEPGGIVTAVDDARVAGARDLARLVGLTSPGEEVTLTVWRDRREHRITVRLGGWPGSDSAARPANTGSNLGLEFGQDGGAGAVIEQVEPASPASVKNLLPGDRILKVDGVPVSDAADASQHLAAAWNAKQRFVVLEVARGPEVRFVALRLRHA
jgi:serine protease Do